VTLEQVNDIVLNGMLEDLCPQVCQQTTLTPEAERSIQMVWQTINSVTDRFDPIYGSSNVIKTLYEAYGGKQVAVRVEKVINWGKAIEIEPGDDHLKWISELTTAQDEIGRLNPPPKSAG